jgi:hypothetical protein
MNVPISISYYAQLDYYRHGFMNRVEPLELIIVGTPGLAKTSAFKMNCGEPEEDFGLIQGVKTPADFYRDLWRLRHLPIVLDDVDNILTDRQMKTMLKRLMEEERTKTASWGKLTTINDEYGNEIPNRFTTRSNFCIILNKLQSEHEAHLSAILSRAVILRFVPSVGEVHRYVGEWFADEEVYAYIGDHLQWIETPDIRLYGKARKLKANGMDWRSMLHHHWEAQAIAPNTDEGQIRRAERKLFAFVPVGGDDAMTLDQILDDSGVAAKLRERSEDEQRELRAVAEIAMNRMMQREIIKVNERGYFR